MARSAPRRTSSALTERQQAALQALRRFQAEHGYPPTRAELGELLGVRPQTADFHLRALERKGFLRRRPGARGLHFVPEASAGSGGGPETGVRRVPVVGRTAAGRPLLAVEHLEGHVPLPADCGADFALRVQGDSMIEAGILDGDLVLVQRTDTAEPGDIVVALLGEGETLEATVKRYLVRGRGRSRRVILRPANPALEDRVVDPEEGFALAGRVVGVLRLWEGRGCV